ncbi:hypothetical protein, partial [Roseibium sediminis]|uniref:hypothetical protein n=1 Tax=Roseibium sediminis TaxID=1775174 RepID=UPI00195EBFE2
AAPKRPSQNHWVFAGVQLSFVCQKNGVTEFWSSANSDLGWAEANRVGRERARELVDFCQTTGDPSAFSSVIQGVALKNDIGGVEVGFLTAIGEALIG